MTDTATGSPTEAGNPRTRDLDLLPTAELLRVLNAEDALVPGAVAAALPQLEQAVDLAVTALRGTGRVHYFGAGSSGRFGVLDAAEVPPTYGFPSDRFVAHLAGGARAMLSAVEDCEDDEAAGRADAAALTGADLAVGLAASGRTPYVRGALAHARSLGAPTVLLSGDPGAALAPLADVHVVLATGPEAIAGSTRMKAGTAQKVALHTFSTAVMVRLGRTYSNLMVDVVATNAKLRGRVTGILRDAAGTDETTAARALRESGGELKVALVMLISGAGAAAARAALDGAGGVVRGALAVLEGA
ncbi:N-acetylmuramic acid 6-phosphate etherase [Actinocorallia herbida]|uniref:N-acetylmuramic acid 6-phosphate etherase n=1 Tax=Actinocorallia herbida TaxID=58109 RepID=A0A3N1CWN5_9ACTN|nr:N-acetylmuramic acid 6-phosphate etherase [Actinocorallia herbida]ROO85128.1 N-acetylmuramic acid 6-phosphate etherase [Actinocorallia herbida]